MPTLTTSNRPSRRRRVTVAATVVATAGISVLAVNHLTWAATTPPASDSASSAAPSASASDSVSVSTLATSQPLPQAATVSPTPSSDSADSPAFKVVFRDDFTGRAGALPSDTKWLFDLGTSYPGGAANWGTAEIQTYTKDQANIGLDGKGNLRITPVRAADGTWSSARIESRRADFKAPEGGVMRVEARLQLPDTDDANVAGYWPAFWMLGAPFRGDYQNWPQIGELDVMENVNGTKQVFGTLHCGTNPGGPCGETTGIPGRTTCGGSTCQGRFHTFAIEWNRTTTPETLSWYVDGVQYHQVREDQLPAQTWASFTSHQGFFLLLNVAIGGAFPAADNPAAAVPGAATTSGRSMVVDSVSVAVKPARP